MENKENASAVENNPSLEIAENKRGEFLGTTSSGHPVYDRLGYLSHLKSHPEILAHITDILNKIDWSEATPEDKYQPFNIRLEGVYLGKTQVIEVPDREGVVIVYAPRVHHNGEPRKQLGTDNLLYSRWALGVANHEIPDNRFVRIILNRPPNQTEERYWLEVITAYPNDGKDTPREAGADFTRRPQDKAPALRFWEGIDSDGKVVDGGHAFVFDKNQIDMGYLTFECPYDKKPDKIG